jgi:hypothetical protein
MQTRPKKNLFSYFILSASKSINKAKLVANSSLILMEALNNNQEMTLCLKLMYQTILGTI